MAGRVAGKMALVTGGAQGLGRAHCIRLAQEGARVLAADINGAGAPETAALINAEMGEGTAFGIAHDVTDPVQWEAAVDAAREHLGGLNVLVNNAGIGVAGNIETCDFADWQRCFDINVNSIFHGCQKALPLMREHAPGSIINISSIAGLITIESNEQADAAFGEHHEMRLVSGNISVVADCLMAVPAALHKAQRQASRLGQVAEMTLVHGCARLWR